MQNVRIGNVLFFLCVLISFAFGSQRKPSFQLNMGFNTCPEAERNLVDRLRLVHDFGPVNILNVGR